MCRSLGPTLTPFVLGVSLAVAGCTPTPSGGDDARSDGQVDGMPDGSSGAMQAADAVPDALVDAMLDAMRDGEPRGEPQALSTTRAGQAFGGDADLMPMRVLDAPAGGARLSLGRRILAAGFVQQGGGADIAIRALDAGDAADLGEAGQIDIQPAVAQSGGHAIAAWFRRIRGNRAGLWVQTLETAGRLRVRGPARAIDLESDAAPYPMAIAPLADGRAAIAWTGGDPPAYRVYLRVEAA